MRIYPKITAQKNSEEMDRIVKECEGIELQYFDENGIMSEFNFEDTIRMRKEQYPNLKEITVHPPLANYNIEMILFKDITLVKEQLKKLVQLSEELKIETNIIFHTSWTKDQYEATGLAKKLKELLKIIENKPVTILIENIYMILDEKKECSAIEIVKHIDHPNLRTCIDTTHVHCKANIYKRDFNELVDQEFEPATCEKYVKQIHFAAALNNDGYIEKKTHGRKHESIEELAKEYEWLKKHRMGEKNYITEVSEEDYSTRVDQVEEIKMLKEVYAKNK